MYPSPPFRVQNEEWATCMKKWGQLLCAPIFLFTPAFSASLRQQVLSRLKVYEARWRNRVHTAVVRPGKLRSFIGETVCLPEAFPRDGNARFFEKRIALISTVGGATTKRRALVPCRQPSPRSVVFRRRPENKVFRLVARQNPFTEGVLAAPPSLKVKATDAAFLFSLRSQYRLPLKII